MEKQIVCNCCGKEINIGLGRGCQDYLHIQKEWGYFSNKDGKRQEINLCEICYDQWICHFQVPVSTTEMTELM